MSVYETDPAMNTAVERRSEIRRKALKGATIVFNKGYSAFECVVRNLSAHGARLTFGDLAAVPHEFTLTFNGDGSSHKAEIKWRAGNAIGVAFV